jgi:folate-binding protein YgfZ
MSEFTYSTIIIRGEDAFDFLQAQLTADLQDLTEENSPRSIRSAWCNPKGRVICIAELSRSLDGFEMVLPTELVDAVVQRLTLFRFRSKVEFESRPDSTKNEASALEQLQAGIPEITLAQSEDFTPHMLNLDLLGIVSLDKGCYPGQEIVARTHYRGASKRRCFRFQSTDPVSAGDKVEVDGRVVGEVVNAIGTDLLAVVPVATVDASLTVSGSPLTRQDLPYSI